MKFTRNQKIGIAALSLGAAGAAGVAALWATRRPVREWLKSKFSC